MSAAYKRSLLSLGAAKAKVLCKVPLPAPPVSHRLGAAAARSIDAHSALLCFRHAYQLPLCGNVPALTGAPLPPHLAASASQRRWR